jgi:hypothetical protein
LLPSVSTFKSAARAWSSGFFFDLKELDIVSVSFCPKCVIPLDDLIDFLMMTGVCFWNEMGQYKLGEAGKFVGVRVLFTLWMLLCYLMCGV